MRLVRGAAPVGVPEVPAHERATPRLLRQVRHRPRRRQGVTHGMMEDHPPVERVQIKRWTVTITLPLGAPMRALEAVEAYLTAERLHDAVLFAVPCDVAAYVDVEVV